MDITGSIKILLSLPLLALLALPVRSQTPPPNPHKAPLYWSVYEHHIVKEQNGVTDNYIPESEFLANIHMVDAHLKNLGYTMVCMDGWGDVTKLNTNGYRASHSRHWEHDFAWWSNHLQQRGMTLGMYGNPLWMHVNPSDTQTKIVGTSIPVSSLINTSENAWFTWCQVDRPGAEEYVKGYIKYYADMGIKYFRVDFLSWYENGQDRYLGTVGPSRPHEHYVTALRWMREAAATNGVFLSLVMPHLFNEAEVEQQYGHMIRINEDAGSGQWWKWSDNARGVKRTGWSVYANAVDGLTYWSYIAGKGRMILDPDFIRINTFANTEEKRSVISACLLAGGPVTISDQYRTIGNDLWFYANPELLALNWEGFVGKPKTNDPTQAASQIWTGQMTNGDWIVGLFNRESTAQVRGISFGDLGLSGNAKVRNLWAHTNLGTMPSFSANIPPHGCIVLKVVPDAAALSGPTAMHVQSLIAGTQNATTSGKWGTATVIIKDNMDNPVVGATVYATFAGSYDEKVSGVTAANGEATLVTTGTAAGDIKVTMAVTHVTHLTNVYSADQNIITTLGDRMFVAGTFSHWKPGDNPMRWVDGGWRADAVPISAGNHELKFANSSDWSGDDWGNSTGLSGTASLATGGAPNVAFTIATGGLYIITFNPQTLAYSIQLQWITGDIGSVGAAGSASKSAGGFTLLGSGADIWGTADEFQFVSQVVTGDCTITARVLNQQMTDPWAKAGVMIRTNLEANTKYVMTAVTPGNGLAFQRRTSTGGSSSTTGATGGAPLWVRLMRAGNTFTSFNSTNGSNWTTVGSVNMTMSSNVYVGLAVTSHADGTLGTVTFDNVSIIASTSNTPPVLGSISNRIVRAGSTLTFTNSASDADSLAQTLTFTLLNAPVGASVASNSGVFVWRPAIAQSPSTQDLSVVVFDSGTPAMSATQSFAVTVTRPASTVLNAAVVTNGQLGFWINGDLGPDYTILASTNLTSWVPVFTTNSPALPFLWSDPNWAALPARFYRALLGP